jgi:pimeloyl-ACP methyl ester carboxylesterase
MADASWKNFIYSASDGLRLAGRKYGWENRDAMPVVCLAGLTRNAADFHEFASYLAYQSKIPRRVLCLDCRGRGMSQYDRNWRNYNVLTEADDVLTGVTAAGLEQSAFVGTSRGGLIIFALTALRPGILGAVVLNDVGPRIEATGLVRIKNYLKNWSHYGSMEEAGKALKAIGEPQFPGRDLQTWIRQAELIAQVKDGEVVPRYDRRIITTLAAISLDDPLPTMWAQFDALAHVPLMSIRGANSDLLSQHTVEQMQERRSDMLAVTVADQGHAPDIGTASLPTKVADFLDAVPAR